MRAWGAPSAYDSNDDVKARVEKAARKQETSAEDLLNVARFAHSRTRWAGRPTPWSDLPAQERDHLMDVARQQIDAARVRLGGSAG